MSPAWHNRLLPPLGPCVIVLFVDQDGLGSFSAVGEVSDDRVTVTVAGEVDMSTADAMFRAATPQGVRGATLDLTDVTFFDSAALHALIRLNERYPGALHVIPSAQVRRVLDISGLASQPWVRTPGQPA